MGKIAAPLLASLVACPGTACKGISEPLVSPYSIITPPITTSAQVGETVVHTMTVTLTNPENPLLQWAASIKGHSPWLTLQDSAGVMPDTLVLRADPTGLQAGTYRDTVLLAIPTDRRPVAVPVEFQLNP